MCVTTHNGDYLSARASVGSNTQPGHGRVFDISFIDRSDWHEPRQPGGCKLKTAPVRPVVAARPA
ncbi:hypothetical protein, partial [Salmonella sp. NW171]|uniref:hypothetical protein n=1 Tax=Salmonella sp. NW171 TaxID=2947769 RepID=UPI003F451F48